MSKGDPCSICLAMKNGLDKEGLEEKPPREELPPSPFDFPSFLYIMFKW